MLHKPILFIIFILVFTLFSQSESIAQKSVAKNENLSSPRHLKAAARNHCKRKWKVRYVSTDNQLAAYLRLTGVEKRADIMVKFSHTHPDYKKLINLTPEEIIEFTSTSVDQDPKWRGRSQHEFTRYLRLKLKKD